MLLNLFLDIHIVMLNTHCIINYNLKIELFLKLEAIRVYCMYFLNIF